MQENNRVRAITRVDFEKGPHLLNGEEVVALMMAASLEEGSSLDEENLLDLMKTVMNKTKNEFPPTQLKELFTQIEANASLDQWLENPIEINVIKSVSLRMIPDTELISDNEGKYYITFERDFLNSIS